MTLKDYVQAAVDTVRDPQKGARWVMSSDMTRSQRWETLILILISSIILVEITFLISGSRDDAFLGGSALINPLFSAAIQLFFLVVMVHGIYFIGRRAGGHGNLNDTILLVAWLQFILTCLQAVQMVAIMVFPLVAALIGLASAVMFFWLLTQFVAELHGFKSKGRVFAAIFVSMIGFLFILLVVLSVFGFQVSG